MAVIDSRLKKGKLLLGTAPGTEFACQATNVTLSPENSEDGDPIEVLCGDSIAAVQKEAWLLKIAAVQDFDSVDGFVMYCFENAGQIVDFSWTPNETSGTWSGQVTVVAVEIGGDVGVRLTTEAEFPINGRPAHTPRAQPSVPATPTVDAGSWTT